MYKKARCTCKIFVLVIKPIAFWTTSLPWPLRSSDLKVPILIYVGWVCCWFSALLKAVFPPLIPIWSGTPKHFSNKFLINSIEKIQFIGLFVFRVRFLRYLSLQNLFFLLFVSITCSLINHHDNSFSIIGAKFGTVYQKFWENSPNM